MVVLNPLGQTPWVVIGDFNDILFHDEKMRGRPRNENSMFKFRTALKNYGLFDLG